MFSCNLLFVFLLASFRYLEKTHTRKKHKETTDKIYIYVHVFKTNKNTEKKQQQVKYIQVFQTNRKTATPRHTCLPSSSVIFGAAKSGSSFYRCFYSALCLSPSTVKEISVAARLSVCRDAASEARRGDPRGVPGP